MAPPIGDLVFFRQVVSDYPGAWHCDPCGAYGYEMADARALPPGVFSVEAMRDLPIAGSEGAWGDVAKPGNTLNGYLVDVRRTGWDMLRWTGPDRPELPDGREEPEALVARVHRECQFPAGERELAYQDFWVRSRRIRGQRRVEERAEALGFRPGSGQGVLDVGCLSGGFLQFAAAFGARCVGVDVDPAYVALARALARSCDQNINVRLMDGVADYAALIAWVRALFPGGVDHLLLLSMEKHMGEWAVFKLLDAIGARHSYLETNAVAKDDGAGPEPPSDRKLWPEVQARGGVHLGTSRDRNLRHLYRIDRVP